MSDLPEPRRTTPVDPLDDLYRKAFAEEKIKQSERVDELAKILLGVELGTVAAYFTLLSFSLQTLKIQLNHLIIIIMGVVWFLAFFTTLYTLFPKKYNVMENVVRRREEGTLNIKQLTILDFYQIVTIHKRNRLLLAIFLFLGTLLLIPFSLSTS